MKAVGIIAEYDPLHLGHAYHLNKARVEADADYVITVISPDFVQRGEPALIDKWVRARMALEAGADLVLELPVRSAAGSAEFFAMGGVRLLDALGCVDALSFGCEDADRFELLQKAARFFAGEEPEEYRTTLQKMLREGVSFPRARAQAFASILDTVNQTLTMQSGTGHSVLTALSGNSHPASAALSGAGLITSDDIMEALARPNNILAIEYIKAVIRLNSSMKVIPVRRLGDYHQGETGFYNTSFGHNHNGNSPDSGYIQDAGHIPGLHISQESYSSASAIRSSVLQHNMTLTGQCKSQLPPSSLSLLQDELEHGRWVVPGDLDLLLHHELLDKRDQLQEFVDIDEDLSNRIDGYLNQYTGFTQFASLIQSRQYTLARIRRSLLHVLLRLRRNEKPALCARVLGFRKTAGPLLRHISEHSSIPLSTSMPFSDIPKEDIYASHLWEMIVTNRTGRRLRHERQRQIIVL